MKVCMIAGLALACVAALSGCAGMSPLAVDSKLDPAAQKVQADAKAAIDTALAKRLDHCHITGSLTVQVGAPTVISGANALGLDCAAEPWGSPADGPSGGFAGLGQPPAGPATQ